MKRGERIKLLSNLDRLLRTELADTKISHAYSGIAEDVIIVREQFCPRLCLMKLRDIVLGYMKQAGHQIDGSIPSSFDLYLQKDNDRLLCWFVRLDERSYGLHLQYDYDLLIVECTEEHQNWPWLDFRIQETGFSNRTLNALTRSFRSPKLHMVSELVALSYTDLDEIPGLGAMSVEEVLRFLYVRRLRPKGELRSMRRIRLQDRLQ